MNDAQSSAKVAERISEQRARIFIANFVASPESTAPVSIDPDAFPDSWREIAEQIHHGATPSEIRASLDTDQLLLLLQTDPDGDPDVIDSIDATNEAAHATTSDGTPLYALEENDAGNALRLITRFGINMRYCNPLGGWLVWDGRRWAIDKENAQVTRWAMTTARLIHHEAASFAKDEDANRRAQWALKSGNASKVRAMLELARAIEGIALPASAFDADPWLLNVANGILELRTGKLRPHDRADLITKLGPVEYDPTATSPALDRYLTTVTEGQTDFEAYLQRACGYSLTGDTSEEAFFLMLGPAATGKSTLAEAMLAMLGDYGVKASFDTFLMSRAQASHNAGIIALRGARFAAAVEPTTGAKLHESLIKEITGGDSVTARAPYARYELTFSPQFKLWLAANESPRMTYTDTGIWRRIKRLPFERALSAQERDPFIKHELCNGAGPALLAWAVQGCLDWQKSRLGECATVESKTQELRADFDPLAAFLESCCVLAPDKEATFDQLRAAYQVWAQANGAKPLNNRNMSKVLKAHGCNNTRESRQGKRQSVWRGVGLVAESGEIEQLEM